MFFMNTGSTCTIQHCPDVPIVARVSDVTYDNEINDKNVH